MKARGNSEGTIRQRPSGSWEGRITVEQDGTRKQVSVYGKWQADVLHKMRMLREAGERGDALPLPSQQRTIAQLADEWLEAAARRVRPNTLSVYRGYLKGQILPELGGVPITKLTVDRVERFFHDRKLASATVRSVRGVLRTMLTFAVKRGYVSKNVAQLADAPSVSVRRIVPFSPAHIPTLLQAFGGCRYEALYCLMLGTGLREGEALGLTLDDLDLKQAVVHVRRTLIRSDAGKSLTDMPKNASSLRTVHIPRSILPKLELQLRRREAERELASDCWEDQWGLLFTTPFGGPVDASTVRKEFHRAIEAAGLPKRRLYDLRHSAASLLIHAGASLKDVADQLGHSQIALTADTYSHLFDERRKLNAELLNQQLGG